MEASNYRFYRCICWCSAVYQGTYVIAVIEARGTVLNVCPIFGVIHIVRGAYPSTTIPLSDLAAAACLRQTIGCSYCKRATAQAQARPGRVGGVIVAVVEARRNTGKITPGMAMIALGHLRASCTHKPADFRPIYRIIYVIAVIEASGPVLNVRPVLNVVYVVTVSEIGRHILDICPILNVVYVVTVSEIGGHILDICPILNVVYVVTIVETRGHTGKITPRMTVVALGHLVAPRANKPADLRPGNIVVHVVTVVEARGHAGEITPRMTVGSCGVVRSILTI
jgi:hypothetical protein